MKSETNWSHYWPDSIGHWWIYREEMPEGFKYTLLRVAYDGCKKIMIMSDSEFFYECQKKDTWWFAKAILPDPPHSS